MKALTLPLNARRLVRDENHALLLDETASQQYLRLALIIRGSEQHVFPALALDDWGREKQGAGLYRWLYEEGPHFPRAELFGFDAAGTETQIFLRDLELSFRYPCFLYDERQQLVQEGRRLHTIFLPGDPPQTDPLKTAPPDHLPWSLRHAAVRWRQIHPPALADAGWRPYPTNA